MQFANERKEQPSFQKLLVSQSNLVRKTKFVGFIPVVRKARNLKTMLPLMLSASKRFSEPSNLWLQRGVLLQEASFSSGLIEKNNAISVIFGEKTDDILQTIFGSS